MDVNQSPGIVPPQVPVPPTQPAPEHHGVSEDTRTIVTVLALFLFYPVGLIVMWVWPRWPKWVKFLISLPLILVVLGIAFVIFVAAKDPTDQLKKGADINRQNTADAFISSVSAYYDNKGHLPWSPFVDYGGGIPATASAATCQVKWESIGELTPHKNFTIGIEKVNSEDGWLNVSVYKDSSFAREQGLVISGENYSLTFNSGPPGKHVLEFINNDSYGYGLSNENSQSSQCSPLLLFSTMDTGKTCKTPQQDSIGSMGACSDILVDGGAMQPGFIKVSYLNEIIVSEKDLGTEKRVSACVLPSVKDEKLRYTKDGESCDPASGACYYCAIKRFPKPLPLIGDN